MFRCRHCRRAFPTRQALGGHTGKKHHGASDIYRKKVQRRAERCNDRLVHKIAKQIYAGMKERKLDPITKNTFKWNRKRLTAAERAQIQICKKQGKKIKKGKNMPTIDEELVKQSDKGRVRRIKEKVWKVLNRPSNMKLRLTNDVDIVLSNPV